MSPELRFVFDANTLVSAMLLEHSVPGRALRGALKAGTALVSQETFGELSGVLDRKRFDRYLTREERDQFLAAFLREAVLIEITDESGATRLWMAAWAGDAVARVSLAEQARQSGDRYTSYPEADGGGRSFIARAIGAASSAGRDRDRVGCALHHGYGRGY